MLEGDYDIGKDRPINLKSVLYKSHLLGWSGHDSQPHSQSWNMFLVSTYQLQSTVRNTKGPTMPLKEKGLTYFEDLLYSRYITRDHANVLWFNFFFFFNIDNFLSLVTISRTFSLSKHSIGHFLTLWLLNKWFFSRHTKGATTFL